MVKAAFVGFGEVNTPYEIIVKKCADAESSLKKEGMELVSVFPVTDDYEEKDIKKAVDALSGEDFDVLVVCIAGWIPTHAVVKVTEHFRHKPMILWGLCGWMEGDRLVTTADQAGTTAIRKTFYDLGYTFKYVYDIVYNPAKTKLIKIAESKNKVCGTGLSMLVCQAQKAQTIWYGAEFTKRQTEEVIEKAATELKEVFGE